MMINNEVSSKLVCIYYRLHFLYSIAHLPPSPCFGNFAMKPAGDDVDYNSAMRHIHRPQGSRRWKRSNISRCVVVSSVSTYIAIHLVTAVLSVDCHHSSPAKHQVGNYRHATASCIKDDRKTNAHFAFHCVIYSWESQNRDIVPWIWPRFKVIPSLNRVVAGHPSHL